MKNSNSALVLSLSVGAVASVAGADLQSFPLGTVNVTDTIGTNTFTVSGSGSSPVRGFYVSGGYADVGGSSLASDLRATLSSSTAAFTTTARSMGGGGSTFNAYGAGSQTWSSTGGTSGGTVLTTNGSFQGIRGELRRAHQVAGSNTFTVGLNAAFTGSNLILSNASLNLVTDIIPVQTGTLGITSPTFTRANGVTGVGAGTQASGSYRYSTYSFTPSATGLHLIGAEFFTTATGTTASFDGFLNVYSGAFTAATPLLNLVGVHADQLADANGTAGSSLWLNLNAGTSYTVVVTSQSAGSVSGAWQSFVAGPVPAPSAVGLLGLAGLAMSRRRR